MILMGVGQDNTDQIPPLGLREYEIREDDIDAGFALLAEFDTQIDHQPLAAIEMAEAIEIAVHTNLTRAP
jgi:hypothetical protein